jgi:hypothetical protein
MPHRNRRAGMLVPINEFIVRFENELERIERDRAVRLHTEMGHGLIGKEIGRVFQHPQPVDSERPIQLSK